MNLNYFSTLTGIGAFEQAVKNTGLGWQCAGYSEIDPYAIKVFEKNHPGHVNWGDIRSANEILGRYTYTPSDSFDLIVGDHHAKTYQSLKRTGKG